MTLKLQQYRRGFPHGAPEKIDDGAHFTISLYNEDDRFTGHTVTLSVSPRNKDGTHNINMSHGWSRNGDSQSIAYGLLGRKVSLFPRTLRERTRALQNVISDVMSHIDTALRYVTVEGGKKQHLNCHCGAHMLNKAGTKTCKDFQDALMMARSYLWM